MVEQGLVQLLLQDAAVSALVATRVHFLVIPEDATSNSFPCIVLQVVSVTGEDITTDQRICNLQELRLQVDCFGLSYSDAKTLQETVNALLNGWTGTLPDGTVVDVIYRANKTDFYVGVARNFRCSTDYKVLYRDPTSNS